MIPMPLHSLRTYPSAEVYSDPSALMHPSLVHLIAGLRPTHTLVVYTGYLGYLGAEAIMIYAGLCED